MTLNRFLWRFYRRSTGSTRMVSFICLRGTVKGTRTTRRRSFSQNTASLKKLPRYMNWCVQLFRYFFFLFLCFVYCFFFFFAFSCFVLHFLLFHVFSLVSNGFCFVAWQRCAWCHWSVRESVRNGLKWSAKSSYSYSSCGNKVTATLLFRTHATGTPISDKGQTLEKSAILLASFHYRRNPVVQG